MKILHVAETIKGGVASVINPLIRFQAKDNEVFVLVPDSQCSELTTEASFELFTFSRKGRNISSFFSLMKKFILLLVKFNPDVVHIHSSFAGVICRFILILFYPIRRPEVIYCPHAFSFLIPNNKIKRNIYIFIERILQCITNKIICTSNYEQNQAINVGMNKNKLCTIYNGIDFLKMSTVSPYTLNKKQILFVGRFDYQKGYDYLIYLIKHLNPDEFEFTIIGDSVHDNVEKISASNVKYLGWLKYKDIIPYYQHATILIMPSRWESFGLVAIEAESFGLPVIANDCSSLPEVILDGKTGHLFDFEKNIDAVIFMLNNKSITDWLSMKTDCIEFVKNRFSAVSMNNSVYSLYKKNNENKK